MAHVGIAMRVGMRDGRTFGGTRTLGATVTSLALRRGRGRSGGGRLLCWRADHVSETSGGTGIEPSLLSSPSRGAGVSSAGALLRPVRLLRTIVLLLDAVFCVVDFGGGVGSRGMDGGW
jgi:hypothetical protein